MRALVLSGGGSYGAYQVGALKALAAAGQANWSTFCGTSVGAINAAFLAQFDRPADAVHSLEGLWRGLITEKVHKSWFFGYLAGFFKRGLRDTSPMRQLIEGNLVPSRIPLAGKKLRVVGVSLHTNETRVWDEHTPNLSDAIMASSAFPMFYAPIEIDGEYCIDGGVRQQTPLQQAIDLGATDIDVVITYSMNRVVSLPPPKTVVDVGLRCLDIMIDEIARGDVELAMAYTTMIKNGVLNDGAKGKRAVNIRLFEPQASFDGDPTEFSPEYILELINLGTTEAKEVIHG